MVNSLRVLGRARDGTLVRVFGRVDATLSGDAPGVNGGTIAPLRGVWEGRERSRESQHATAASRHAQQTAMFSLQPHLPALPQNAEVHIRLRWHRGILGLPVLAPAVVVGNRHPRH
jgi:hypothetical protein